MRILLIHASAGAGHQKAAEAIAEGLEKYTDHEVTLVDGLDYTSKFFKTVYRQTYSIMISKAPWAWGFFFGLVDIPSLQPLIRLVRRIQNSLNGRKLHQFLVNEQFDYIISTHFMPNEVAASLKREKKIRSKIISVVTDYDVHKIWLADEIDIYAVASEWTKEKISTLGVSPSKVVETGIPTSENFSRNPNIGVLKKKLGLKEDVFTVLVATGSFGIGPIEEIINTLKEFQIIVVCGHNKNLFERLSKNSSEFVKVMGLVDNMDELMAVSDVMVTKPGGLSISEALVSQLPLIFFNAIPGQEANNVSVLRRYGIGISDCSIKEIAEVLNKYKNSKDEFLTALKATKRLAHPAAVTDIISLLE